MCCMGLNEMHFLTLWFLWCFFSKRCCEERAARTEGKADHTKCLLRLVFGEGVRGHSALVKLPSCGALCPSVFLLL